MSQRWVTWSLAAAAFLITLAISSWQEGLWTSSDHTASPRVARPQVLVATQAPNSPFGPSAKSIQVADAEPTAPPAAQSDASPPAPPTAQEQPEPPQPVSDPEPQTEPYNTPDVDNGEMLEHADRAARRSARSH